MFYLCVFQVWYLLSIWMWLWLCLGGYWWFGGASSTVAGVVSVCVVRVVSVCVARFGNCLVAVWWFDGSVPDCNACLGLRVGWWWVSDFGGFLFGFGNCVVVRVGGLVIL